MATKFGVKGKSFFPTSDEDLNLVSELPVGNFIVQATPQGQLFFTATADFDMPPKLYGDTPLITERIMNTFQSRSNSTGVLLSGEKGSGKTLQAKALSILGKELGMPTIIINAGYCGDSFNQLMQNVTQPCIVMFDEFEKTYVKEAQEQILTLLDGVFPTKKLYIFTCNDENKMDTNMKNRPGRIFYYKKYKGLDPKFIKEYCDDNLANPAHSGAVVAISGTFYQFNFDMLKALVEEMNRYNEDPFQAITLLNAKSDFSSGNARYKVEMTVGGKVPFLVTVQGSSSRTLYSGNPLMTNSNYFEAFMTEEDKNAAYAEYHELGKADKYDEAQEALDKRKVMVEVTHDNISLVKDGGDIVEYKTKEDILIRLTRHYGTEEVSGFDNIKRVSHFF